MNPKGIFRTIMCLAMMMMNHIATLKAMIMIKMVMVVVIFPSIPLNLLIVIILISFTLLVRLTKAKLIRIMCH